MSRLCLTALALLAVLAPPASAAPPWSDPETVSSASLFVEEPNVVFAGDGNALATWRWSGPRPERGSAPGGTRLALRDPRALLFGPEHTAPNFVTPLVSSDLVRVLGLDLLRRGSGRASLRARFGDSRSTFDPPRTITTYTPAGGPPSLDAPNGTLAAWIATGSHGRRIVRAALRSGERFGDPFTLRGRGRANDVVVGSSVGVMFVAWERAGVVEARVRLSSRGGWGPVQRLGSAAKASTTLRATGSGRRVYLAWLAEGSDSATLRAAALPVARTRFNPTQTVDRIDHAPPAEEHSPELVSVPERGAVVAWTDWDGARWRVRAAAAERSIRFGPELDVSPPGESAVLGDVASVPQGTTLPPHGTTLVVWSTLDSAGELGDAVRAALRPLGGAFGPPEDVSDLDRARLPAVAVDFPVGRWTVIWSQRIGPDQPGVPLDRITTFARSSTRPG